MKGLRRNDDAMKLWCRYYKAATKNSRHPVNFGTLLFQDISNWLQNNERFNYFGSLQTLT